MNDNERRTTFNVKISSSLNRKSLNKTLIEKELGTWKRVLSVRFNVVQNTGFKRCSTRKQGV
jgi:hypothetical protein